MIVAFGWMYTLKIFQYTPFNIGSEPDASSTWAFLYRFRIPSGNKEIRERFPVQWFTGHVLKNAIEKPIDLIVLPLGTLGQGPGSGRQGEGAADDHCFLAASSWR
jgi:hypothetical protein